MFAIRTRTEILIADRETSALLALPSPRAQSTVNVKLSDRLAAP